MRYSTHTCSVPPDDGASVISTLARPGLTLVLGPPNSGKMGYLLEWWRARLPFNPALIAPTGPDAQELTIEMVRRVGALIGQETALTFERLVAGLLGGRPTYISDFQRDLILKHILDETPLSRLAAMTGFPGTLSALAGILRGLEESGISDSKIQETLAAWGRNDPHSAALAEDLARIARSYQQARVSEGLTDRPAAVRAARDRVGSWRRPVALYGFNSFTPGQRLLIQALAMQVPVILSLPYEASGTANLAQYDEVARWQGVAREVIRLAPEAHAYSSPHIAFLAQNFRDAPSDSVVRTDAAVAERAVDAIVGGAIAGPHGVRFLLASGERNEAELAAEHIADLIRLGFSPERIGVVVRHVRPWSSLLSQVFDSCGIPYRLDYGLELRRSGLGHAFLNALIGMVEDNAAALLALLRTPYSGVDAGVVSSIETSYRRGFRRGAAALMELFGAETPLLLQLVGRAVTDQDREATFHLETLREMALAMLLSGLRGLDTVSRDVEEDARAYDALDAAMAELEQISGNRGKSEWLATRVVLPALERLQIPAGSVEGQQAVQILSPWRARARRFDALFILGLVEGEFPASLGSPSLVTESQRAWIDRLGGGGVLPPQVDSEEALFANAICRAWQVLYLSARDTDDGGGEATPSRFWLRCKGIMRPGEEADSHRTLADQVFALPASPTLRHYRRACAVHERVMSSGRGASQDTRGVARWTRGFPVLNNPAVLADLAARPCFSPSELEQYLECPFGWFLQRVVGDEEVDSQFDGRAFGKVLHSVLSLIYRELGEKGLLPLRPEQLHMALDAAFTAVDKAVARETCVGSASEKRVAAWRLKRMTEALLRAESVGGSTLAAVDTEFSVGGREGVDIGGLAIKGRIDRIDAEPAGSVGLGRGDKSGSVPPASAIGTERGLQLPLYLMALAEERKSARVIGGAYLSLADQKRSGIVAEGVTGLLGATAEGCRELDTAAEEEITCRTMEGALSAADGIRGAKIAPSNKDCPSWCNFGPICRSRTRSHRG